MVSVRTTDRFCNLHLGQGHLWLGVFGLSPCLQESLEIGAAARVTPVLEVMEKMKPSMVSIFLAFSQERIEIQFGCRVQSRSVSGALDISQFVTLRGSYPVRLAVSL